jgi:hypothetical protein
VPLSAPYNKVLGSLAYFVASVVFHKYLYF